MVRHCDGFNAAHPGQSAAIASLAANIFVFFTAIGFALHQRSWKDTRTCARCAKLPLLLPIHVSRPTKNGAYLAQHYAADVCRLRQQIWPNSRLGNQDAGRRGSSEEACCRDYCSCHSDERQKALCAAAFCRTDWRPTGPADGRRSPRQLSNPSCAIQTGAPKAMSPKTSLYREPAGGYHSAADRLGAESSTAQKCRRLITGKPCRICRWRFVRLCKVIMRDFLLLEPAPWQAELTRYQADAVIGSAARLNSPDPWNELR